MAIEIFLSLGDGGIRNVMSPRTLDSCPESIIMIMFSGQWDDRDIRALALILRG